jgi:putative ABC transport system ATP-binding protein
MTTGPAAIPTPTESGVAAHCVALTKRYGTGNTAVVALDAVDVAFSVGQFTAIMGPSGSGKSTLMHCMAGLDSVTSGAVFIGDIQLDALDDRRLTRLRRDRVGFVFQAYNLVPTLTALENITLPMDIAGHPIDQAWLSAVIDTLGLRDRLGHRPNELSGGQQQRVACARALAGRPAIVFADEPTGNLDSRTGAEVLSFLRESVRRTGQTIAMVTHDPSAAAYADRVLFLADGRIVDDMADPTAEQVLERMKAFEADVPHPEVVWAEPSYVPPTPVPTPVPTPETPAWAPAPASDHVPPPPAFTPPPTEGSTARRMPVAPPVAPPPAASPPVAPPPAEAAPAAAASSNGPVAPDAVDMANWTDADWDAWLSRKQTETGSGA